MILVDSSQVILSTLFAQITKGNNDPKQINENLIRHVVLTCLLSYKRKFGEKYGKLVICVDNRTYWRKIFFPYYKANRAKDRRASKYNWKMILDAMHLIRLELEEYLPYQVLDVDRAEADDIIGILSRKYHTVEPILILSRDKDFAQLQKYSDVKQYDPLSSSFLKEVDPTKFLRLQILLGDKGDGVPNFLSSDDAFVRVGGRQVPIRKEKLELWSSMEPERFCTTQMMRGYKRNEALIDLDKIPPDITVDILSKYEAPHVHDRSKLMPYFIKNGMKNMMEHLSEF